MTNLIPLRPFPTDALIARLAELQRLFDRGDWTGRQALGYVVETSRIIQRLKDEFGMTELQIYTALHALRND